MSRILVAVSSPYAAERVVDTVGDLAKRLTAEVLVVHVSRPSGGQMREQEQAEGEQAIRYMRDALHERGLAVQDLLMFSDDIARAILNTAIERDATMIVLGFDRQKRLRPAAGRQCAGGADQKHPRAGAHPAAGLDQVGLALPMTPSALTSDRADALAVLTRLRDAGHVAYFAGGCVRDLLLGRSPKDWDVATDAPPEAVRRIFPHTQAVGAAFGVILVRQRRSLVEVATFRSDGAYVDGRHPQAVAFTTAEDDARRRDFTINGLFLDPISDEVIDYVGGQADLAAGVVRAIGQAEQRFGEDHLRLLRAVRFAARLNFTIEPATAAAIASHAPRLARISPERVAAELRVMLPPPSRPIAWRLLTDLGLAHVVFRFVDVPLDASRQERNIDSFFPLLSPEAPIDFALALAAAAVQWWLWAWPVTVDARRCFDKPTARKLAAALRQSLKLSNGECEAVESMLAGLAPLLADEPPGVATLKRFLARSTAAFSRSLMSAMAGGGHLDSSRVAALSVELARLESTDYAPAPLITGDDLTAAGVRPGPAFKRMLDAAYDAQLQGQATTRDEAMAVAMEIA